MPGTPFRIIEIVIDKKDIPQAKTPLTYRQQIARDKLAENAAAGRELPKPWMPNYRAGYPDKKK